MKLYKLFDNCKKSKSISFSSLIINKTTKNFSKLIKDFKNADKEKDFSNIPKEKMENFEKYNSRILINRLYIHDKRKIIPFFHILPIFVFKSYIIYCYIGLYSIIPISCIIMNCGKLNLNYLNQLSKNVKFNFNAYENLKGNYIDFFLPLLMLIFLINFSLFLEEENNELGYNYFQYLLSDKLINNYSVNYKYSISIINVAFLYFIIRTKLRFITSIFLSKLILNGLKVVGLKIIYLQLKEIYYEDQNKYTNLKLENKFVDRIEDYHKSVIFYEFNNISNI